MTVLVERKWTNPKNGDTGTNCWFWCPGCKLAHAYQIAGTNGPIWEFNRNFQKPTFKPSLRVRGGEPKCCHLMMTDGKIKYYGDSTHKLAGKTINMEQVPDWLLD